jgi:hypothetical protein
MLRCGCGCGDMGVSAGGWVEVWVDRWVDSRVWMDGDTEAWIDRRLDW